MAQVTRITNHNFVTAAIVGEKRINKQKKLIPSSV